LHGGPTRASFGPFVAPAIACGEDGEDGDSATSVEEAIRLSLSLGGDANTQACIAGAIAEARFGRAPEEIVCEVRARLTDEMLKVLDAFEARFGPR